MTGNKLKKQFLIGYDNYGCAHKQTRKRQFCRDRKCKQALADLHDLYVLVPADNNVVIVCEHYYN